MEYVNEYSRKGLWSRFYDVSVSDANRAFRDSGNRRAGQVHQFSRQFYSGRHTMSDFKILFGGGMN